MVDPRLYDTDHFVVLEPNQPEQFLTAAELLQKLETMLAQQSSPLPPDLQRLPDRQAQAQYLLDAYCEFDVAPGQYLQWYAVRLEK